MSSTVVVKRTENEGEYRVVDRSSGEVLGFVVQNWTKWYAYDAERRPLASPPGFKTRREAVYFVEASS